MNTADRLRSYYCFDEDILDTVNRTAEFQNRYEFDALAAYYDIEDGPQICRTGWHGTPLEVLMFLPHCDYDQRRARIMHIGMNNTVSKQMALHGIRLFGADPTVPLIMIGNPAGPGHKAGTVKTDDSSVMRREHTLRPVVEPTLLYLAEHKISDAEQLGYSYGADKAAAAAGYAPIYGIEAHEGVYIEPASAEQQPLWRLTKRFMSAWKSFKQYIEQCDSLPYEELRSQEDMVRVLLGTTGLLRMTNLAIASVLAHGGFEQRVRGALDANCGSAAVIGWGSESELADDFTMHDITWGLEDRYPRRVKSLRLEGMHHAGGDDIDLYAAIFLQGLRYAETAAYRAA